jgi:hypothetical protein
VESAECSKKQSFLDKYKRVLPEMNWMKNESHSLPYDPLGRVLCQESLDQQARPARLR